MEGLGQIGEILEGADMETIAGNDALLEGLGAVRKANPAKARQIARNAVLRTKRKSYAAGKTAGAAPTITGNMTSRGWFEMKKAELPAEVRDQLASGVMQSVDCVLYAAKSIDGQQVIQLFGPSDDKRVGYSNVNGAKLDAGDYFLVDKIAIDFGTFTDNVADCTFSDDYTAAIKNGEFEFKVGSTSLLPDALSMEAFNYEGVINTRSHLFTLANPKWIVPQQEIKPKLNLTVAGGSKEAVKITLFGTKVAKR